MAAAVRETRLVLCNHLIYIVYSRVQSDADSACVYVRAFVCAFVRGRVRG